MTTGEILLANSTRESGTALQLLTSVAATTVNFYGDTFEIEEYDEPELLSEAKYEEALEETEDAEVLSEYSSLEILIEEIIENELHSN